MRQTLTSRLASAVVLVLLSVGTVTVVTMPSLAVASIPTQPSAETARSLYMNNWADTTGIWMSPQLAQTDTNTQFGPRLGELHYSSNGATSASAVNQIVDYSGFFRDESNGNKYDQIHNFSNATGYLDSGGVLRSDYGAYNGTATTVSIGRDYAFVPNQHFLVVKYRLHNSGASAVNLNILDAVHLNNAGSSGQNVSASWDATRTAADADMSASGQYHVVLGALDGADGHQVGDDTNSTLSSSTVAPWYTFDNNGTLSNNASVTAMNVDLAISKRVNVPAGGDAAASFYLAIANTVANANAAADTARAQTGTYWLNNTTTAYSNWLAAGARTTTSFTDSGLSTAFDRSLVVIKQSQSPVLGVWPAATNPIAYGYKSWVRDSAVTALALDSAGHHAEADKYFRWLASVQYTDGSFGTTYDGWTGQHVSFVEPELDSVGIFLIGAYRHWIQTGDNSFRDAVWPALQKAANFVSNNIASNGLGPKDASIWEETQEYNAFTQALYISGLWAAEAIAQSKSDTSDADTWSHAVGSIATALQTSSLNSPAGMWNSPDGYFNRAVNADNTGRATVDASSDMLMVSGVIDPASSRAVSHLAKVVSTLTHDTYGLARYQGDNFYYTSPYSPAGNEALAAEPSWPQMSMYAAIDDVYTGNTTDAMNRLTWYASRTAVGYMPPGEAVSNVSQKPIVSTMVESVTGAWYVLAALAYTSQTDTRMYAPISDAGSNASLTVSAGTTGDWPQWNPIPYFVSKIGNESSGVANTDIKNVAIANDSNNIYIRIDNASGTLPGYNMTPRFAVHVYAGDYSGSSATATSSTAMYGTALPRPAAYMVGRWSDSMNYARFTLSGGVWTAGSSITSVAAPQWDPSTGRIEVVIPRSALTSGTANDNTVEPITIALVRQNPTTGAWSEDDQISVRYRLTPTNTAWIYGNVR